MTERAEPVMSVWTLFQNPSDAPGMFVLRRFDIVRGGVRVSLEAYYSQHIEGLRARMRRRGLLCLPRSPNDDPCIVETWI
jgi:hypothetical protein